MSIQSEITRLSGNVSDALDAIEAKGVTIPSGANSDDLADLIGQISGGGGTGTISQDQDGYLVLSPDGDVPTLITKTITQNDTYDAEDDNADGYSSVIVNVLGGGGFEYEEGIWTPDADISRGTVNFQDSHTLAPVAIFMADQSDRSTIGSNSNIFFNYIDIYRLFGNVMPWNNSNGTYVLCMFGKRAASSYGTNYAALEYPSTTASQYQQIYPKYWAQNTKFMPYANDTTTFWKADRSYKWVALWEPET